MPTYRDEALVLRTYPLGEADRIIVALTRGNGKVRAVARGVRRTSSKFGGRLASGNHVDVQFAVGRGSLDVIAQLVGRHEFDFAAHYPTFTAAQVLLEAADRMVAEDRVPAEAQFNLLLGALVALRKSELSPEVIVDSYLLRGLAIGGFAMALGHCASCGKELAGGWFAPAMGGLVCDRCRPSAAAWVDEDLARYLRALSIGDWQNASVELGSQRRASGIVMAFTQWQLERGLRSLDHLVRED